MKVSYYPGCSLEGTARPYDKSTRQVCRALGIELKETPEWACCGSSPAQKMNRLLSVSLSAHNLALVEQQELSSVVAPCPFCFRRLKTAQMEIGQDKELKKRVEETIERPLQGGLDVHSLLGFLRYEVGLDAIKKSIERPLTGLKVVPYYGCYQVKPPKMTQFDDPENPTSLDEILDALGADVIDWDFKAECCGAGLSLSKTETVCRLSGRLIREAAFKGAEAIVVICQLCQANLDMRQTEISARDGISYDLPIIYFTELIGLSQGRAPSELGLDHHLLDPLTLLKQKGLA